MTDNQILPVKILVPCGSLGAGVREEEVDYGLAQGAQAIASDAGSTDSGAAYLATGKSKNSRGAVKRDLTILMKAHEKAGIPVIIGTSGQAGGDLNVDWTRDILLEVVEELGLSPKIALLYSEQTGRDIKSFNADGRIKPLPPLGPLEDEAVDQCDHIVALMGVEPYIAALEAGADVILGGRSTDPAVLASFPIWKGAGWGPSWHAGKIGECGAQCADKRDGAGVLLTVGHKGFEVEPLAQDNLCTPQSVGAHMLYENTNPYILTEPGGQLDVTGATYEQLPGDRAVRVNGAQWVKRPYTMKLEGAGGGMYQTIMLVGIQDPDVLADVSGFHDRFLAALDARARESMPPEEHDHFNISVRMYGWNAVDGAAVPEGTPPPREIGALFVATARSQELANAIAHACNPYFFHYPAVMEKELPSYGFAFTPADVPRGQIYEFKLNHVVEVDDPLQLVRTEWINP
ncbi:acyclic terpene utilization AtuA family protein [Henriciella sp. AS95]|uniref:acyclic terpene utilization AtuA family protein n=1 Tax=Henriciella sp. AS95 TaxID=3135782 RepID=UPI00316B361E